MMQKETKTRLNALFHGSQPKQGSLKRLRASQQKKDKQVNHMTVNLAVREKVRKPKSKKPPMRVVEKETRTLHRVGTLVNDVALDNPNTVGNRLAARRLELNMTQAEVAEKVFFQPKTGTRKHDSVPLSRNAYCMYETDSVEPDLPKIEAIAKVLGVTPQWLAFGIDERKPVKAFTYVAGKKQAESWVIPEDWLIDNLAAKPEDVDLHLVQEYNADFSPGDVAIIKRDVAPTTASEKFLFVYKDKARIAHITKPHRSKKLRVFKEADAKNGFEEILASRVQILGRVVGRVTHE